MDISLIAKASASLAQSRPVVALTGAGVSAESGVPTFRGADGLWRDHDVTRLATPEAFARDPRLVWEFYNWRRGLLARCEPNPAHLALAAFEARRPEFTLITQNVDGLHAKAGSRNILELHGSIWRVRCPGCGLRRTDERVTVPYPPACPRCGGMLRPDVVWFGESLDEAVWSAAVEAVSGCRVMLVMGTSAVVHPAAALAPLAKRGGAAVIEINLESTPNSGWADYSLLGMAGEITPRLLET